MRFKKLLSMGIIGGIILSTSITSFATSFSDTDTHWSRFYVERLSEKKVINGYSNGLFKPDNSITREEVSTVLSKYIGTGKGSKGFKDITGRWSEDYITGLVEKGLVSGYPDGTFKPTNNITRAEFATIISKYLEVNNKVEKKATSNLTDISGWANESIKKVVESGYMSGYEDNTFRQNNNITRGEVATVIALIDGATKIEKINGTVVETQIEDILSDAFPDYLVTFHKGNFKNSNMAEGVGLKLWATDRDSFTKEKDNYVLEVKSDVVDNYTTKYFGEKLDHSSRWGLDSILPEGLGGMTSISSDGNGTYKYVVSEYISLNKKYKIDSIMKINDTEYLIKLTDNGNEYQILFENDLITEILLVE